METNRKPTDWDALVDKVLGGNSLGNSQETIGKNIGNFSPQKQTESFLKKEAEQQRQKAKVYLYKLTDNPSQWLKVISPYGLAEAEESCRLTFGDRFLEIRE